jgi:hypothetical protein
MLVLVVFGVGSGGVTPVVIKCRLGWVCEPPTQLVVCPERDGG